ncbi:Hypp5582 [Branchiostoma lanceolatum]|nr:Hypp5582 [Branchiostoma lanceolatum]
MILQALPAADQQVIPAPVQQAAAPVLPAGGYPIQGFNAFQEMQALMERTERLEHRETEQTTMRLLREARAYATRRSSAFDPTTMSALLKALAEAASKAGHRSASTWTYAASAFDRQMEEGAGLGGGDLQSLAAEFIGDPEQAHVTNTVNKWKKSNLHVFQPRCQSLPHQPALPPALASVGDVAWQALVSQLLAPRALAPQAMAPQAMAPQAMASQAMAPQAMALQAMASQAMASQAVAPQAMVPQVMAPQAVAPQVLAPQGVAFQSPVPPFFPQPLGPNQCRICKGEGHFARDCPSRFRGRGARRGNRGGRF